MSFKCMQLQLKNNSAKLQNVSLGCSLDAGVSTIHTCRKVVSQKKKYHSTPHIILIIEI